MSTVVTPAPPAPSKSRPVTIVVAVVAAAAIAACLLLVAHLGSPKAVESVTVVNPGVYNLEVSVSRPAGREVGLGTVGREGRATFEGVIDPGDRWVFHFAYGGAAAGELTLDRDAIRAERFVVQVPPAVSDRLAVLGLAPSSPSG